MQQEFANGDLDEWEKILTQNPTLAQIREAQSAWFRKGYSDGITIGYRFGLQDGRSLLLAKQKTEADTAWHYNSVTSTALAVVSILGMVVTSYLRLQQQETLFLLGTCLIGVLLAIAFALIGVLNQLGFLNQRRR